MAFKTFVGDHFIDRQFHLSLYCFFLLFSVLSSTSSIKKSTLQDQFSIKLVDTVDHLVGRQPRCSSGDSVDQLKGLFLEYFMYLVFNHKIETTPNVNIAQQELDFCLLQILNQLDVNLKGDLFKVPVFADLKWLIKDIAGCSIATSTFSSI